MELFLEEYEKLCILGEGSFATIYKVRHKDLGNVRAIKVSKKIVENEHDKAYQNFLNECKVLLKLGNGCHPNIVRIYQPRLIKNHALVEMDYVEGCTLHEYLQHKGFISIDEVLRFVQEIAGALAYCHVDIYRFLMDREADNLPDDPDDGRKVLIDAQTERRLVAKYGITHNDLHSNNIMRKEYDGGFVLLDFGLAIQNDKSVKSSSRRDGAVEYKAPEKWDKDMKVSTETDVYGFGVLMYEILTGQVPFPYDKDKYSSELEGLNELSNLHKTILPPPIEPLRRAAYETATGKSYEKDYPEWLELMIMKCLEKKPENRYANGKELYDDLRIRLKEAGMAYSEETSKLKGLNNDLNAQLDTLVREKGELKEQVSVLVKQLAKSSVDKDEMEQMQDSVGLLTAKINELSVNITQKEAQIEAWKTQRDALKGELEKSRNRNSGLQTDMEKLQKKIEDMAKPKSRKPWIVVSIVLTLLSGWILFNGVKQSFEVDDLRKGNADLKTRLAQADSTGFIPSTERDTITILRNKITEYKQENEKLKQQNATPTDNGTLAEKDREIERLKKENNSLSSTISNQTQQINQLNKKNTDLEKERDSLIEKIKKL